MFIKVSIVIHMLQNSVNKQFLIIQKNTVISFIAKYYNVLIELNYFFKLGHQMLGINKFNISCITIKRQWLL